MQKSHPFRPPLLSENIFAGCRLCPHSCGVNRKESLGFCQCKTSVRAAKAQLHYWEEPCISGVCGSGAIFFSGCTLHCCYCQNYSISHGNFGKSLTVQRLADIFLRLQEEGAHNINLVTATPYLPQILSALDLTRHRLRIPVVYNCGGYERTETVQALNDYIDIWLPDLKYYDSALSSKYSGVSDYFSVASRAITQMIAQTGAPQFSSITGDDGSSVPLMKKGVIIRHLVLPGHKDDSQHLLHWIAGNLPKNQFYLSLLSQYTPCYKSSNHPEINRRITSYEYEKVVKTALELGLEQGFMQKRSSAKEEYTPLFDLQGL